MSAYFDSDIELLQRLIGRDLSHWRKFATQSSSDKPEPVRA